MQLARIVFAGALLCGAGCVLPEEEDLATDEGVMAPSVEGSDAVSESMSGAGIAGEEEFQRFSDDQPHGSKKNWRCTYCYKRQGDKECYYGKDKEKYKAKRKAEYKCENEHDHGCKFYECRKSY